MGEIGLLLGSTLALSAPLMLAALGGYTSERSGVINIALEGMMITSCCATALIGLATGSAWLGVAGGLTSAVLLSMLHWLLTQNYRMNPIISGMGINAVALGGTNYMSQRLITVDTPDKIPVLPESLYYVLAVSLPVLVAIYAATTRGGLWLKAAGGDPRKARLAGLRPDRIRLGGLFATGVFSGLSGVLIVTHASRYVDGMTDGRGYIALAALILGGWKPVRAAVACLAFGFFSALQIQFQGTNLFGAQLPSEVWSSFPFVATVFALALLSGQSSAPPGLGKL